MGNLLTNMSDILKDIDMNKYSFDLSTKEGNDKALKMLDELEDNPYIDIFFGANWKEELKSFVKRCYHKGEEKEEEALPEYIYTVDTNIKDRICDLVDEYVNTVVTKRTPNATTEQIESVVDVLDDFAAWMYQHKD